MAKKNLFTKTLDETLLNRRSFLKWSSALGGTAALGITAAMAGEKGVGLKAAETAAAAGGEKTLTVSCYHNCGGRCVLGAVVKDGAISRIVADPSEENGPNDPPRAIPCLRGRSQTHRVYAPERLKYPLKRVGKRGEGKFERISWNEALDTIAGEMKRIKSKYGNESFFFHYASGTQWKGPDGRAPVRRLMRLHGGYTDYYNSYSTACYNSVRPYITGGKGNSADDVLNSKLIVLFGDNSVVTRSGGDNFGQYLLEAKNQGIKIICVDPMLTDTAVATEAEWIPIYPGTDVALIAALSLVMVKEGLYDKQFMEKYAVGFDEDTLPPNTPKNSSWMAYIDGDADGVEKTPEWAAKITGIPADRIVRLAREIATTKPCAMFQGWGWQRRAYGEQPVRALPVLAAMTGNFAINGGGPGLRPSGLTFPMGKMPLPPNPVKGKIPVFKWPDFITRGTEMTDGPKDRVKDVKRLKANMKFMWNHGGNTIINQHSDINMTKKILADESKLEFIVVVDNNMTPSAKFADILLPETTSFEIESILTGEGHGEKGSTAWAIFNHKLIEPLYESKEIYWICDQLANRLGIGEQFRDGHKNKQAWLLDMVAEAKKKIPDFPSYEEFKKMGVYKIKADKPIIAFEAFVKDPGKNPLKTPTGKIEVYSPHLAAQNDPGEIPAIPKYIPEWEGVSDPLREKFPLLMVSAHAIQRSHSTFDNIDYLQEAHPQAFWINTVDAGKRGIKNGDQVKVFNDRGEVHLPAFVTNRVRPGVSNMPQGAWYTPDAKGIDTRGSANVLSKYHPTPFAKGNPQHTNLVQVEKI